MKAIICIETTHIVPDAIRERLADDWRKFAASGFTQPLILSGATIKVIYVPDNFSGANIYTPEEAQVILEMVLSAKAVIM